MYLQKSKERSNMQGEILQVKSDRLFHDLINENEMDTIEWLVI